MTDCTEWQGRRDQYGYGRKWRNGRDRLAHALTYVDRVGDDIGDIDGWQVNHTCDNPPCVNSEHLYLGTQADNMRDRDKRGRHRYVAHPGEANGQAKLTDEQALEMIARYEAGGVAQRELAAEYGVSQTIVSLIVNRKIWRHL